MKAHYSKEPHRMENLEELMQVFRDRDDIGLDPISSLENILHFVALAKNVDRLDPDNERVRILTVHQSKGLEFDIVFVAVCRSMSFRAFVR